MNSRAIGEGKSPEMRDVRDEGWVRVTVEDLTTGEKDAVEVRNDYVLIAVGDCYLEHTNVYSTGTHILTIKGSKGQKREVLA